MNVVHPPIEDIMSKAAASFSGQAAGAALMIWSLFYIHVETPAIFIWTMILSFVLYLRYRIYLTIQSHLKRHGSKDLNLKAFYFNVLLTGMVWGGGFIYYISNSPPALHFMIMAIAATLAGAAILTLGSLFRAYLFFTLPMSAALAFAYQVVSQSELHNMASVATLIGAVYLTYTAFHYSRNHRKMLEHDRRVQTTQMDLIKTLARASEYRDEETGNHVLRMSYSCFLVAKELGYTSQEAKCIMKASSMHDIGKIGIPDRILLKPGKLTETEREIIQTHTDIGLRILEASDSDIITSARKIIAGHHEKWDGSGYPNQIAGRAIPLEARIAAVCDVFDALISDRPYKKGWPYRDALQFILDNKGSHFDPEVVDAFVSVYDEVIEYSEHHLDRNEFASEQNEATPIQQGNLQNQTS